MNPKIYIYRSEDPATHEQNNSSSFRKQAKTEENTSNAFVTNTGNTSLKKLKST